MACAKCGHQFSINLQDSKAYRREYFEEEHANWFLHPDVALFARIKDLVLGYSTQGRQSRIIDVGCGPGAFLDFLHSEGFTDLHGLDVFASDSGHFRRIVGEFESTPLSETFDVVVSMMNIEHVPDPNRYIGKMADILSGGGVAIINTIDSHSLIYRLARALHRVGVSFPARRLYEKHHLNHFTWQSLDTLMARHGFACRQAFGKNYPMNALDLPRGPGRPFVLSAIAAINGASEVIGSQISQTKAYLRNDQA
jgi:2-polyprenyl-3-methyl-5-hydroxy-6-metoxy-1,4-benzoquinol methylase